MAWKWVGLLVVAAFEAIKDSALRCLKWLDVVGGGAGGNEP